jgi:translocation and assembly module TamB
VAGGLLSVDTLAVRAPRAAADALGTFGLARGRTGELSYRVAADSLGAFRRYLPADTGRAAVRPAVNAARVAIARQDSIERARSTAVAVAAGAAAPPVQAPRVDSLPALPRDSLSGAVYAAGTVRGGLQGFDLRGRAGVQSLVALGNQVERARVAYTWIGAMRPDAVLAVAASADSVRAAGFQLDSLDARGTWRKPGGTAQVAVFQDVGRSYALRGEYAVYPDRSEARFSDVRLRFDTTVWASTRLGTVRWGRPGLEVDDIELVDGRGGRIFADGTVPTEGAANLRLQVQGFELADALGLVQSDVPMRGRVTLDAALTGTRRAPLLRATAALDSANYRGTAVPATRAGVTYAAGRAEVTAEGLLAGRRVLTAEGSVPVNLALEGVTGPRVAQDATVTATARLDSLPLDLAERFTDAVSNVRGAASGTLTASGSLRRPVLTGEVRVPSGQMRVVPLGITLSQLAAAIRLRGDTVVIDSIAGNSQGRILLAGGIGIRDVAKPSFDLRLRADRARMLDGDMGRINANAQIAVYGPFDRVFVSGGARVLGGTINIPKSDGTQSLSAGDPSVFAVIDTTRLANQDLVPAQSPLLQNLRVDVSVGIDRDTWVRSDEANVEIYSDGDLRVQVDRRKQALVMDGVVNTDRGEYTYLSKRFQVKRGTVTFLGTQELDPNLQIAAEYDVRQAASEPLTIRILIGGQLSAPRITLESDATPPIPQSDLLTYLAFGQTSGSLLNFGGSSISGQDASRSLVGNVASLATTQLTSVALGELADEFERQTARSLGADQFNITPSPNLPAEVARADISGAQRLLLTTQIEYGKYFNRQLFVGLQATPLFWQAQPAIPGFRVQYRFASRPGLSIESAWQPRFFPGIPTLGNADLLQKNAFGAFLVRQWRF